MNNQEPKEKDDQIINPKAKGIFEQIREENSHEYVFQVGELWLLSMTKAFMGELTPKQEERYKKLLEDVEYRENERKKTFLAKWGEDTVKAHEFLTEKFGEPSKAGFSDNQRTWRISSWLDESDASEGFEIKWYNGYYELVFFSGDGYNTDIVLKNGLCSHYIYNCIEHWVNK